MGLYRSDRIVHKRIRMPGNISSSVRIMDKIGNIPEDTIQFIDLTKDDLEAKKNFAPLIKRCEDMESKLSTFETFAAEYGMKIPSYESYASFINDLNKDQNVRKINQGEYFDKLEAEILEEEKKITDLVESFGKIKDELIYESYRKLVMEKYFMLTTNNYANASNENNLLSVIGIVDADHDLKMKRMLFRAGHDKIISTFFDLEISDDVLEKKLSKIKKKIFVIFAPNSEYLIMKINKICDLYNCTRFEPADNSSPQLISSFLIEINKKIKEQKNYLLEAKKTIQNFLSDKFIMNKKFALYKLYFKKEKMIYINLSKCILRENFIDGEVWILQSQLDTLRRIFITQDESMSVTLTDVIDLYLPKPTHIKTNEFTYPFQEIINLYGIPTYGEINPGYFTIITFPFLFGIMFGDIGHGFLIFLFGCYLCLWNSKIKMDEHNKMRDVLKYRYFILLLGLFSLFCGFIYNDFLSIPLNLFGTCYNKEGDKKDKCTYPFGLDPKWYIADNELSFFNSFKMKFSVIVGVIQMIFGIIIKGLNDLHFRHYSDFVFVFIPQLIFMTLLFGYMIVMIFIKWLTTYEDASKAPSIITIMINIFINKGKVDYPLWKDDQFMNQEQFNRVTLYICFGLIPIMLFPKPIIHYLKNRNKEIDYKKDEGLLQGEEHLNNSNFISSSNAFDMNAQFSNLYDKQISFVKKKQERNNFIEIFIHQLIETIEFTLSTVSNTASYLRLWALSLAHAELSKVFIEKTFMKYIESGEAAYGLNIITVFITFFIFANVTIFVLIFMDALECGLHTLRLHWVEFQNKFYSAEGYLFVPFSFKYLINKEY